ncbi:MAG: outer membrane protein assembly factor BamA [Epsilonproteobacteria bacterium]|nr:outer membrane protein assembly factor BamA [Campylobacterota bacterium]
MIKFSGKMLALSMACSAVIYAQLPNITGKIVDIEASGVDEEKIAKVLGIKKGEQYSPAAAIAAKNRLEQLLREAGYREAKVKVSAKREDDGIVLKFDVDKGEPIKIKKVTFIGNKHLSDSELKSDLVNKEGGLFSWIPFIGGGEAVPAELPYDQMRVRDVYLQHGYVDAQVSQPIMKTDFSSHTATITYHIKEGAQYKVGKVSVTPVPGLNMQEIKEELKLKSGKVFNVKKLREDIAMLQKKLGDLGYAYAVVEPRFQKDPVNKRVSVTYVLRPGQKYYINNIIISGNKKTKDHVIRRYIYLTPGELFNATDYEDSKIELQKTGFFDEVQIIPQKVGGNKLNLLVKVKEAQTGSIAAGLGYGSYEGLGVTASISDRNMFGTGIAGSLSVDLSKKSHNFALSFSDPRVFDSLFSASFGIYHSKYEFIDYTKKEKGGYLSIGRKLGRHWKVSVGYSYSDVDYSDYDSANSVDYQSYKKGSIFSTITFDNTDDYFTPRKGFFAQLYLEYAGLGGSGDEKAKFIKYDFKFAAYKGLEDWLNYDLILRYKFRYSHITDKGYVPIAEKLYLGGASWGVRGFDPASISPINSYGDRIGGMKSMVTSLEASIPVKFVKHMRLTAFVDYGMIGEHSLSEIKRASAGAQIEWRSPFGPVTFIFAKPLNKKDGDRTQTFEFSIAKKF